MDDQTIRALMQSFDIRGDFIEASPYGNGHINDTFRAVFSQAGREVDYLVQRINARVFTEPEKLMDNIARICGHLKNRAMGENLPDRTRRVLTLVPSTGGRPWVLDEDNRYWRCYLFIEGALGHDIVSNTQQAREAARCFGEYIRLLSDIPGEALHETIPRFHDTPWRYANLLDAMKLDPLGLADTVRDELSFFMERSGEYALLTDLQSKGKLPLRVVHNDTKLNNILIDSETHEGLCVIDLDTSMPGISLCDFGDLMRTSTSPVPEDHPHPGDVRMDFGMFKALAEGFLEPGIRFLNQAEIAHLPDGGRLMTLENGMRFLSDYLLGSPYYKIRYPEHNLHRCRTQIALAGSIEDQMAGMKDFVEKIADSLRSKAAG